MGNFSSARTYFNASLSQITKEDSEKQNLYLGLATLAAGLEILEATVNDLHLEIERIYRSS